MTVNRNETITIPKWLLLAAIPVLVSVATAFGFEKAPAQPGMKKFHSCKRG